MGQPLISVVLPTFNRARWLDEAIGSVLGQTYRNLELIVVDDGSTDRTEELVSSLPDSRLRYLRNSTNSGVTHAVNCGLSMARGEYVCRIDADDVMLRDALIIRSPAASRNGGVLSDLTRADGEARQLIRGVDSQDTQAVMQFLRSSESRPDSVGLSECTMLIHRDIIEVAGFRDEHQFPNDDYEWLLRILARNRLATVRASTYFYRRGHCASAISLSYGTTPRAVQDRLELERRYLASFQRAA